MARPDLLRIGGGHVAESGGALLHPHGDRVELPGQHDQRILGAGDRGRAALEQRGPYAESASLVPLIAASAATSGLRPSRMAWR